MSDPPGNDRRPAGEPPEVGAREPLGSLPARLSARLFDAALMMLPVMASEPLPRGGRIAVLVVFPILYETAMVAVAGRTAGKMLLGLHVVRRHDGARPRWGPSLARAAPSGILAAGPVVAAILMVLSILPMVGDVRLHRSIQDRLARTVVVQRRRPWAARSAPGRT